MDAWIKLGFSDQHTQKVKIAGFVSDVTISTDNRFSELCILGGDTLKKMSSLVVLNYDNDTVELISNIHNNKNVENKKFVGCVIL
jgi:hypothetical protein